ncbi:hypothetical protein MTR67_034912, partial [Solanum verrucosum]
KRSYVDGNVCELKFTIEEKFLLKVSPVNGVLRFGKKDKLNPRFIDPFEVLLHFGEMTYYMLGMPPNLSGVHPFFHVLMLKKCCVNGCHVIQCDSKESDQ